MMKVTVLIPALNEAGSLIKTVEEIPKKLVEEILVVDGGSHDDTVEVAKSLGCRVIIQSGKGYGNAMRLGFRQALGDVIISLDADGSQDPRDIPKLLKEINQGYDLVLGSRYLSGAGSEDDTIIRFIGNKFFTSLTNLFFNMRLSDSLFLFVAMKKKMLEELDLRSEDFALCIEIPVKAYKAGYKICEVKSIERKRFAGDSKVNAFIDGVKILSQMFQWWKFRDEGNYRETL